MDKTVDLRHVKYFLAVVETLHFSRAATKLGMAQPNLSLQIRKLEEALGCSLFERTTRGVVLTSAGAYLARRAEMLQTQFADIIHMTQQIGSGKEGTLAIGFSGSAMYGRLPLTLERFRRQHPGVAVQLREMYAPDQMPLLLDGTLDVGFIRDGSPTAGLRITPLTREPFLALLPRSHPLAKGKGPIGPGALRNERFVLFAPRIAQLAFERTMRICQADGFTPEIALEAPQWVTIVSLVAAGMGVSLAPASVNKLNIPGVVFRPLRSKGCSCVDAWTKPHPPNPAARVLLAIAQEEFSMSEAKSR